jgi:hypothetical protein
MDWICSLKSKYSAQRIIMAAHGNIDSPVLLNSLSHYGHLSKFMLEVDGFCDTVKFVNNKITAAFERLYPGETFEAHNALGDAEALYKILLRRKKHESHFIDLTSEILGGAI